MGYTTIKRIQTHRDFFYTIENTNIEVSEAPGEGLTIRAWNAENYPSCGSCTKSLEFSLEETLALRDALNELYPGPPKYKFNSLLTKPQF